MDQENSFDFSSTIGETPLVTIDEFARRTGMTKDSVRGYADRGQLPVVRLGSKRLINLVRLTEIARQSL